MKLENLLDEAQLIQFKYANFKHDPKPLVKVLDMEYPGQEGQKTYGQREDLLGYNINYFKNKKYADRAIDEIDSFARMLSANKQEVYRRIKAFFPKSLELIRRYQRKHMKDLKTKGKLKDWFWKSTTFNDIVNKDREEDI